MESILLCKPIGDNSDEENDNDIWLKNKSIVNIIDNTLQSAKEFLFY